MKRRPKGTGHIYMRERGKYWWYAIHINGRLIRASTKTTIKTDAEKILRDLTHKVDTGEMGSGSGLRFTLDEVAKLVITDYENNERRTPRNVKGAFAHLRKHFGGDFRAKDITAAEVEEYKSARRAKGRANGTINRELAQLRRGLRLAVKMEKLTIGPSFSLLREAQPRGGFLEPDQFDAIAAHLPEDLQPLVTFTYWTGWRITEATTLEWRMVDRKAGVIRIERTKNDKPKTVPYAALPVLKDLIEAQHAKTKAIERAEGRVIPWVFHRGGEFIKAFAGAWDAARKKAGLPGRLVHDMRRSAARNMIRVGVSESVAMAIGGWKTASVFKRYAIVDETMIGDGLRKLDTLRAGRADLSRK